VFGGNPAGYSRQDAAGLPQGCLMPGVAAPQVLGANFAYVPDLWDANERERVRERLARDIPWILAREQPLTLCGVGRQWHGSRTHGHMTSRAVFQSRRRLALDGLLAWLAHLEESLRLARKGQLLVFTPSPQAGAGAALARAAVPGRIRLVVRVQGSGASKALYVQGAPCRSRLKQAIESAVIRRADLVVPMGDFTRDHVLLLGATPSSVIVVPFPVWWEEDATVTELPDRPTALFAGRLEKEKGVHILIEAMVAVSQAVPGSRLLVAGDGQLRHDLERRVAALELEDRVEMLGWVQRDGVREVYERCSVLVLPSLWEEGLGMVLVEAGLSGRAVIGTDRGGIRDVIHHGENGLLVAPGNVGSLADALVAILGDPETARRMGLAGRRIATSYLATRAEALRRFERAVDELMAPPPSRTTRLVTAIRPGLRRSVRRLSRAHRVRNGA
jgi:glycosyltransferase involved in cell wall biosynthesis